MELPDIMPRVVERDPAALIHMPHGDDASGARSRATTQTAPPPRPVVGPTGMHQTREELKAVDVSGRGRPRRANGPSAPTGPAIPQASARPRLAPPRGGPLGTFDDPVLLGTPRVVPVHPDTQADQPQRQSVGKSPRDPQGQPLSTRKLPGNPQRPKANRSCSCTVLSR